MRYSQEHKDSSRKRLVGRIGSHAKQHGFNDSGMAALAASAGMTTGALYKHFDGKADLFAALIAAEMERTAGIYAAIAPTDRVGAEKAVADYLSLRHVRQPERGCPLPSLTPEVARADAAARQAFQDGLLDIHAQLQRLTATPADAWTLMAQNVGAVMLARAITDERLQREVLASLRQAGTSLLA
jgi:AcrR family transcriptional regulator